MKKRILIDCSGTYFYEVRTGIQRTVRNIVEKKHIIEENLDVIAIPVIFFKNGYISLNEYLKIKELESKSFHKKIKMFVKSKIPSKTFFSLLQLIWHRYKSVATKNETTTANFFNIQKGDYLFFIDAFWQPIYDDAFFLFIKKNQENIAKIFTLIYDLIPIDAPQYCEQNLINSFIKNFNNIISCSSAIITISKSEKNIIENYLKSQSVDLPVEFFYLGSDLNIPADKKIRPNIEQMGQAPFFLMVGSIEPRKNYLCVLEAFKKIWENDTNYNLVIVGKPTGKHKDIISYIKKSSYYKNKLFLFENILDAEIDFLYSKATALIFASTREGFGLPLVEAMQKNVAVIASDIDVFREIGKDYPVYFNPNDPNDLIEKIELLTKQSNNLENKSHYCALNWDESVKMLCEKLRNIMGSGLEI